MPEFYTLAEADAWRAVHAPARGQSFADEQSSPKNQTVPSENRAGLPHTTTKNTEQGATTPDANAHLEDPIDIESFVRDDVDFDLLMIQQSQRVPQIAYGLLGRAAKTGQPGWISAATKNWQESARAAADVRTRFQSLQKEARILITLDEVMDVVGTELQAVRTAFEKFGERCAMEANPSDPALAREAIDKAVDHVFTRLGLTIERTRRELSLPAA